MAIGVVCSLCSYSCMFCLDRSSASCDPCEPVPWSVVKASSHDYHYLAATVKSSTLKACFVSNPFAYCRKRCMLLSVPNWMCVGRDLAGMWQSPIV